MSFFELGKRIPINAPAVKPLTPTEKRAYDLLREGKAPIEIARLLHIRMGGAYELQANVWDVPITSIYNIIISIREKGYEIKSKEEIELAKLTEKDKEGIIRLKQQGCAVGNIAAQYGVSKSTVHAVVKAYEEHGDHSLVEDTAEEKNEPAAAATVAGSEETVQENVSEDIVPPSEENVKTPDNPDYDYCKESEMYDAVAELVKIEIDFLRTQILDFQHDLDRCYHRYELLCEYLKMNERAVKEENI